MTVPYDSEQARQWLSAWQDAGPKLQRLRDEELRAVDTQQALVLLADLFEHAIKTSPPLPTSGLVEQQRLFAVMRRELAR